MNWELPYGWIVVNRTLFHTNVGIEKGLLSHIAHYKQNPTIYEPKFYHNWCKSKVEIMQKSMISNEWW